MVTHRNKYAVVITTVTVTIFWEKKDCDFWEAYGENAASYQTRIQY
jgi:hypothetical protein